MYRNPRLPTSTWQFITLPCQRPQLHLIFLPTSMAHVIGNSLDVKFGAVCGPELDLRRTMATILRRIIELALARPSTSSSSDAGRTWQGPSRSSLGSFDEIPEDVLVQILRLLGPKGALRMSLVCKSWRSLVSDDSLWIFFLQRQAEPWESIFFAETNLQMGYPIQYVFWSLEFWLLQISHWSPISKSVFCFIYFHIWQGYSYMSSLSETSNSWIVLGKKKKIFVHFLFFQNHALVTGDFIFSP